MTVPTVLMVDDDKFMVELVSYRLLKDGFEFVSAESGKEALAHLELLQPDILIVDYFLADTTGPELIIKIRADERFNSVKILMLTANDNEQDIKQALLEGANEFMTKPFRVEDLTNRIQGLLSQ